MEAAPKVSIVNTEIGPFPDDWQVVRLDSIGRVKGGKRLPLGKSLTDKIGEHPYIRVSDMRGGSVDQSKLLYVPDEIFPLIRNYTISCDDLFISVAGTLGLIGRVPPGLSGANLTENADKITDLHCDRDYLYYCLSSQRIQLEIDAKRTIGAQPKLAIQQIEAFRIPLPPSIEEQKHIARTLTDIDDLIASLDAVIAKKRDIKQAAMQQLLTGKTRLPGFATTPMTNSAIGNLPSDWEVRPLGSLGDPVIGLTYRPVDVRETGTLVLRSSNVQDGVLAFDNNVFVDPEVASRALVAKGDILICVRNGSRALIGKCAMISDEAEGMAFGAFMSVFRSPHSDFLFHQFQSNIIQRQIHEHLGATINQITNASLRSFQVPFPVSAEERGAIVTILSDMDAELTGLTVKLSKLNMVREGMMQQLLTGRIRLV